MRGSSNSSISFYFRRPSLVSCVVLVEGGERVGVLDAAVGVDIGGVVGGGIGRGGHGGAEGRRGVGAARAVLAVGGAQVGLWRKKALPYKYAQRCKWANLKTIPSKSIQCIKLKCFLLFNNMWKLHQKLLE